jgi:hypothetical protein
MTISPALKANTICPVESIKVGSDGFSIGDKVGVGDGVFVDVGDGVIDGVGVLVGVFVGVLVGVGVGVVVLTLTIALSPMTISIS